MNSIVLDETSLKQKVEPHSPKSHPKRPHNRHPTNSWTAPIFLVLFVATVAFLAFFAESWWPLSPDPLVANVRLAMLVLMTMSIILSMLYLPDGLIGRPSQLLWKGVTGFSMFYLVILLLVVFLEPEQTQWLLKTVFDTSLGVPLPEKSYANDCRVYIPGDPEPFRNLSDSFLDIFVLAHLVGWFVKTLILRDLKLALIQSVVFQALEVMWRHYLPNFYECWWDHAILDVLGMNLLGIMLGWWVIKRYNLEKLKWSLRESSLKKPFRENVREFLTHSDVSAVEYKVMTSTKKFLQVVWFIVFVHSFLMQMPLADLTFFFNKFLLHIPPAQYINSLRIWMMGLLCVNASKEYYAFITGRQKEMKINAMLAQLIVLVEVILFFRNYRGQFDRLSYPWYSQLLIAVFGIGFLFCLTKIIYSDLYRWWRNRATATTSQTKSH